MPPEDDESEISRIVGGLAVSLEVRKETVDTTLDEDVEEEEEEEESNRR